MGERATTETRPIQIRAGAAFIDGDLTVPARAQGLVVFAHGSGSSRFSRPCGRPDLAGDAQPRVQAPTLLIVGGADDVVIDLNRLAMQQMRAAQVELEIVPGATHLFEEPGALAQVSRLALEWCRRQLSNAGPRRSA